MNNIHKTGRTWQTPFGAPLLAILITLFTWGSANAQVTTNGGSGLAASYPSLDAAITALNGLPAITAPVVITLTANETAPVGGYVITATGTPNIPANNSIVIQGLGTPNPVITANGGLVAGTLTDAIFKIVGGDFIRIENLTMQENPANTITAAATNNMTEWGVALLYATTTNGAQNDTIRNNRISLNQYYGQFSILKSIYVFYFIIYFNTLNCPAYFP